MRYSHLKKNNMFFKQLFDYLFSIIALITLFPFLFIISFLIIIIDHHKPFYLQLRVGKNGQLFNLIKFRTMIYNSNKNNITTKDDSRITRIGKILRKTKVDELPELLNILKGEMSFVGPRPDVSGYADKLAGDDRVILSLKPGITGLASLKYMNEEEILSNVENPAKYNNEVIWPDKVKLNKYYIQNWSFWLDIKIIIYTLLRKKWIDLNFSNI